MSSLTAGSAAPVFALSDLNGELVRLEALRGKPVLLNFYKSTCPWCQVEMPRLAEVYRHQSELAVHVLGVSVGKDDQDAASRFAREKKLEFPIVVDDSREVRQQFDVQRVPTLVLIDAQGTVQRVYEGSSEQLRGIVEQTLLASAGGEEPPEYHLVGNGCGPD